MAIYRRSDGKEREGFVSIEAGLVQDAVFDAEESLRMARSYLNGEDTVVDSLEAELLNADAHLARALRLVELVNERAQIIADETERGEAGQ